MGEFIRHDIGPEDVVRLLGDKDHPGLNHVMFLCPACGKLKDQGNRAHPYHLLPVVRRGETPVVNPSWDWNGDLVKPTLSPSIRAVGVCYPGDCHFFMRDGYLEFCGDSGHDMKGQKVKMEPVGEL